MPRAKRKKPAAVSAAKGPFPRRAAAWMRAHPVAVLMLVSAVLGIAWMIRARPTPFSDYLDYYTLAKSLLDDHQFGYPLATARRLPAYPALLALFMTVSRSFVWLGLLNILLSVAFIPVAYRLALALSDNRRIAVIAAAICALDPTFIFFSPIVATEHLFVLLFYASFLPLVGARIPALWRVILSGAILGLAVLTRGEALFYLPVVLFVAWTSIDGSFRRKAMLSALVPAVCILVVTPWLVRNHVVMGSGVGLTTTSGNNFYYGHNPNQYGYHKIFDENAPRMTEIERQREVTRRTLAYLRMRPSRVFDDIGTGTPELLWESGSFAIRAGLMEIKEEAMQTTTTRKRYPPGSRTLVRFFYRLMLFLVIAGLLFYKRIGRNNFIVFYGIILMNWICYAVIFWSKPRFRFTAEAAICILTAFVVHAIWENWREHIAERRARAETT